jgi:hypothetical protein
MKVRDTVAAATAVLLAVGLWQAPAGAAVVKPANAAADCAGLSQTSERTVTTAGAGAATVQTFSSSGGTRITTTVPPAGWSPLTATDQQLKAYGFRPRPADPGKLASWRQMYAHYRGVVAPKFCTTDRRNAVTSGNWSGIIATSSTYTEADGEWAEPSFVAVCSTQSSYSMWPGIGGYYGGSTGFKLIQAGTDTGTGSVNDLYTWIELISGAHGFPEIETNAPVSPGDTMAVWVAWDAANQAADFEIYNVTQGWDGTLAVTAVNGVAASNFYDGGSAEVISERATSSSGQLLQLRKPSTGYANYDNADFNDSPAYNDPSLQTITMETGSNVLSTADDLYGNRNTGFTTWTTTWHRCS